MSNEWAPSDSYVSLAISLRSGPIFGGYIAWLIIPIVATSGLGSGVKAALTAFLGATPLLMKLIAIGLLGRPTIDYLKSHSFKWFDRESNRR